MLSVNRVEETGGVREWDSHQLQRRLISTPPSSCGLKFETSLGGWDSDFQWWVIISSGWDVFSTYLSARDHFGVKGPMTTALNPPRSSRLGSEPGSHRSFTAQHFPYPGAIQLCLMTKPHS